MPVRTPWWLALVAPLTALGVLVAALGLLLDSAYEHETSEWVLQAHAQDAVDLLVAFPAVAIAAWLTRRGSRPAHYALVGALVNVAYAHVIYAFSVHFGPLFLGHVAVLSMTAWSLVGASIAAAGLPAPQLTGRLARRVGVLLVAVAAAFSLLWLGQIVPATVDGTIPTELEEVGLATNPVHVLDLAFLLPLTFVGGIALLRGRELGARLAPVLLVAVALIGIGVLSIFVFQLADGYTEVVGPAAFVATITIALVAAFVPVARRA